MAIEEFLVESVDEICGQNQVIGKALLCKETPVASQEIKGVGAINVSELTPLKEVEVESCSLDALIQRQTMLILTAHSGVLVVTGEFEEGNDPHYATAFHARHFPKDGLRDYRDQMRKSAEAEDYPSHARWVIETLYFFAHVFPEDARYFLKVKEEASAIMNNVGYSFLQMARTAKGEERSRLLTRATKYLNQARKLDPLGVYVSNNLGEVYRELGDFSAARENFSMELKRNPHHPTAKKSLEELGQ